RAEPRLRLHEVATDGRRLLPGAHAFGYVLDDAFPTDDLAVGVEHGSGVLVDPDPVAVGVAVPELSAPLPASGAGRDPVFDGGVTLVGMDETDPQVPIVEPVLDRVSEDPLDLIVHEERPTRVFVAECEDDHGEVVDEGPEAVVGVVCVDGQAVLGHSARVAGPAVRREPRLTSGYP